MAIEIVRWRSTLGPVDTVGWVNDHGSFLTVRPSRGSLDGEVRISTGCVLARQALTGYYSFLGGDDAGP